MSDSLDLLLTARQPTTGRRAPPVTATPSTNYNSAPQPSPTRSRGPSYDLKSTYDRAPIAPSPVSQRSLMTVGVSPMKKGSSSYDYEDERSVDAKTASPYASEHSSLTSTNSSNTALGASLINSLTSKLTSEPGQAVNWSALKAKRAGSASTISPATTSNAPQQPFVPSGPKSAAAGLSDSYVKQNSPATPVKSTASTPLQTKEVKKEDDTVIGTIFPMKTATLPQPEPTPSPVRRNPFAAPTINASPFATATSSLTRPAPIASSASSITSSPSAASSAESNVRQVQIFECPDCHRKFKRGSLMKHQKVCKKVFQSKRGPFDSSKVRTQDLGLENIPQHQAEEEDDGEECEEIDEGDEVAATPRPRTAAAGVKSSPSKKSSEESKEQDGKTWKDQSESLREAMRRAKKNKAQFHNSNMAGIDMRAMMMVK